MQLFSIKFWIIFQIAIDLILVFLIIYFLRSLRSGFSKDASQKAAGRIIGVLEPLLKDADATAGAFEEQLKEKHRLIHHLNERLDSRIISLNLLLNRAEGHLTSGSSATLKERSDVYDQQKAIIELFNRGHDAETVAEKLSLPKGEVEMVFNLKRKFIKIEKDMPVPGK
jgi:hypothetical protein